MLKKLPIRYYWICQLCGWAGYILFYTFFYYSARVVENPFFFKTLYFESAAGLLLTHAMRYIIKGSRLLDLPLHKQIIWLILITLSFALIYSNISVVVEEMMAWEPEYFLDMSFMQKWLRTLIGAIFLFTIWSLLYFTYHYVSRLQRQRLNEARLQGLVKELELKTIKAHINPHFIFNALNSIRALVDENPSMARKAITQLSMLLRSSMRADKDELVPLSNELEIVKNYLALEQIRFEDRLKVHMDIDEDTLSQQVPPMMLQTLVENAIKHGISKEVYGGKVEIVSDFVDDHHEIVIRNTGRLSEEVHHEGFGLSSTRNRLQLLYDGKASFDIKETNGKEVEARVVLPVGL